MDLLLIAICTHYTTHVIVLPNEVKGKFLWLYMDDWIMELFMPTVDTDFIYVFAVVFVGERVLL